MDPSLGADSVHSGVKAAIIGTLAVSVFMLAYYLIAGLVANVALMLNIVILLGVMCSISTTLTLPGIAGLVLTAGMAVDANVLIYERIREEWRAELIGGSLDDEQRHFGWAVAGRVRVQELLQCRYVAWVVREYEVGRARERHPDI